MTTKKQKAFQLRLEGHTMADVARHLKVSSKTVQRWEKGYIDTKGRRYKGWKEELQRLWDKQNEAELKHGLMLKTERLKTYQELANMAIEKVKKDFPNIQAKTPADVKALTSEIRELCKLISIELGEYPTSGGNQTLVAVKTDISLSELQRRYNKAHGNNEEEAE